MRCLSCNVALSKFESTRKSAHTGEYLDLCNRCYKVIEKEVEVVERPDLLGVDDGNED
jgi:hypothetical protein